jgi:glutathione S-transferase
MKLYSLPVSPFAARCRMLIYAKGLAVDIEAPPGGVKSDLYAAINPLRKVPSLDTGDEVIPESEIIVEYLEEHYPDPPLSPDKPLERARARLMARIGDLYVLDPMVPLFSQLKADPRDRELVETQLEKIRWGLKQLEHYVGEKGFAVGSRLSTADCALAPILLFVVTFLPAFGVAEPFKRLPKLDAYWTAIQQNEYAGKVLDEIRAGLTKLS